MNKQVSGEPGERLFSALRRLDRPTLEARGNGEVAIRLAFDDEGAYLAVVNGSGQPCEPDYRCCRGALRDLLKAIDSVRRQRESLVGWEDTSGHVYLHEHGHLLWLLRDCGALVDESMQPITFVPGVVDLVLNLMPEPRPDAPWVRGELLLLREGECLADTGRFRFVNETHVLVGERLYETAPVGENFRVLPLFADALPVTMLERSLSLLFSQFTGVAVRYADYRTVAGDDLPAQPCLLFQKTDEAAALHFDLAYTLPGFPLEFVRQHDITRVVLINEAERTLVVRHVLYGTLAEARQDMARRLHRHQKSLGAVADTADGLLYVDENGFILGCRLAELFLSRELGDLVRQYTLFGADRLKPYRVRPVTPKLNLTLTHGIDFLEGDAALEIEGESFSLLEALAQYRKNAYIALADGTRAVLDSELLAKLSRLFRKQAGGVRLSFFDLPLVEELIDQNTAATQFAQARDVFLGFNTLASRPLPDAPIVGDLRPYQADGVKWLDYLHAHRLGGCLADDMGLGKTIQAIKLLAGIYPREPRPSLLVMPRTLLFNWRHELERFCPALTYGVYHGTERDLDEAMKKNLVLTTYGTLRHDIERFVQHEFYYVILDESQAVKNVATQTAKAALLLRAHCRLALSGTPFENNLGELYALFRFLNPAMFGSAAEFERDYATPIHQHDDKEAARALRKKIYPFILRRTKRDVLKDLPDKVEQVLYVDMSADQQRLYEARRRFYHDTIKQRIREDGLAQSRFFILEALMELRQVASIPEAKSEGAIVSPKRETLLESLQEAVANGHKALVFTNFLAAIELLSADLDVRGLRHLVLTGATSNREVLVRQFQADERIKVFLMTLKTGGVGLNLTAADMVFIFDPWWNTAAELQAVDRTHRIGQDRTVFTYKLIARGTIEEKILLLQERKRRLFDTILTSDEAGLKAITEADVDIMLG